MPISKQAIGSVHRALGINRYTSTAAWWAERDEELRIGMLAAVAAKIGLNMSTASVAERGAGRRQLLANPA